MYLCVCRAVKESELAPASAARDPDEVVRAYGLDRDDCCGRCLLALREVACGGCELATTPNSRLGSLASRWLHCLKPMATTSQEPPCKRNPALSISSTGTSRSN